MRLEFTQHAVERFIERLRPDLSYVEALKLLAEAGLGCEELWPDPTDPRGTPRGLLRRLNAILVLELKGSYLLCITVMPWAKPARNSPGSILRKRRAPR